MFGQGENLISHDSVGQFFFFNVLRVSEFLFFFVFWSRIIVLSLLKFWEIRNFGICGKRLEISTRKVRQLRSVGRFMRASIVGSSSPREFLKSPKSSDGLNAYSHKSRKVLSFSPEQIEKNDESMDNIIFAVESIKLSRLIGHVKAEDSNLKKIAFSRFSEFCLAPFFHGVWVKKLKNNFILHKYVFLDPYFPIASDSIFYQASQRLPTIRAAGNAEEYLAELVSSLGKSLSLLRNKTCSPRVFSFFLMFLFCITYWKSFDSFR